MVPRGRIGHPIADAELRQQNLGSIWINLDFLSQLAHEDSQVLRIVDVSLPPHRFEQVLVSYHFSWVLGEHLEQTILFGRKIKAFAVQFHRSSCEVDDESIQSQRTFTVLALALTPQHNLRPRQQFRHEKRLHDIIVRAEFKQLDLLGLARPYRQNDHRNPGPAANPLQQFRSVDVGQRQVENHKVDRMQRNLAQRIVAVRRLGYPVAAEFHAGAYKLANLRLVVDNKYVLIAVRHVTPYDCPSSARVTEP